MRIKKDIWKKKLVGQWNRITYTMNYITSKHVIPSYFAPLAFVSSFILLSRHHHLTAPPWPPSPDHHHHHPRRHNHHYQYHRRHHHHYHRRRHYHFFFYFILFSHVFHYCVFSSLTYNIKYFIQFSYVNQIRQRNDNDPFHSLNHSIILFIPFHRLFIYPISTGP